MATSYTLLSTHPPTRCGLAIFAAAQHEYGIYGGPAFLPRVASRPVVLTWGLLGPGKGIGHAIDAMAVLCGRGLHADYRVARETHPRLLGRDGGFYRQALMARVPVRDVADQVRSPHAVELLGAGAGLLVGQQDPAAIAHALQRVLTEPGRSARLSRSSADLSPYLLWPAVARSYRQFSSSLIAECAGARA